MKDPALLWYFNDWIGGTQLLNRHQKGCYIDLLAAEFNNGPLSLEEIKNLLGADFAQWQVLQKKFSFMDGRYYNKRLEEEKERRANYTASRRQNAKHMHKHMETINETENETRNEIPELIKAFEAINPACKKFYGNTTQRTACQNLIDAYTFDRVKSIIELTLPKTNKIPYFPVITTPVQLRDKWASLEAQIIKANTKAILDKDKNGVAFW